MSPSLGTGKLGGNILNSRLSAMGAGGGDESGSNVPTNAITTDAGIVITTDAGIIITTD